MKSRITVEVDFDHGNVPVIQILQTGSEDVRDKLVKSFTECLDGSSWCRIQWVGGGDPLKEKDGHFDFSRIFITPVKPDQLKEQATVMLEQAKLNERKKE